MPEPATLLARAYTVASLSKAWECSPGVIRKLVASGALGHFRIGTLIRIPADEVQRFECQNTASNDSAAASPLSGEMAASESGSGYTRPTGLALRRKLGKDGETGATVHRGPWGGS
jgi:excisionase family DNA binding protein